VLCPASAHPPDDQEANCIADIILLTTGSVAEFYIEPMLPHIGDVDVMYHYNTDLAIPRKHPPPKHLPAEFSDYVKVFEIVDSHWPGYVYLELRYLLTYCTDDDKYNCFDYDRGQYLTDRMKDDDGTRHGPAIELTDFSGKIIPHLNVDGVHCTVYTFSVMAVTNR